MALLAGHPSASFAQSPPAAPPQQSSPTVPAPSPTPVAAPIGAGAPVAAPVSAGAPAATPSAASAPSKETLPAVAPVPTVAAPVAAATPAPASLNMPTETDRQALAEWKNRGNVGQSTFMDKLRTVTWALAFICFLIWLAGKFVGKSTLERFGLPVEQDSLIEVLEKKRLSPGRSVMLLRVGPKVLAIAVTESGFTTLTELDGEALKQYADASAEAKVQARETVVPAAGPADIAKHYLSIIPGVGVKK